MDDIQVWIYILFGIIYFITRALRKKPEEQGPQPDVESGESMPRRQPKSFEDLLREFTEAGQQREVEVEEEPEPAPVLQPQRAQESRPTRREERQQLEGEGRTRHFADDESRRVYEESIRQAEGSDISYERDEHFKIASKVDRGASKGSEVASEIKEMLSNPSSARKAIILSEILNRRY